MNDQNFPLGDERLPTAKQPVQRRMLKHYELISELGQGGMGKVYKAWDTKIKRFVALKTLIARDHETEVYIQRFSREVMSIARLQHPGIVRLYDIGMDRGMRFFTMEYIDGATLDDYAGEHKMRPRKIAKLMQKIASTIHYAHQQKIIHRDLKPGNIMIDRDGEPHITDFGLAKMIEVGGNITKTGMAIGTPSYMSPEQADGLNDELDERTDVFSLGTIFYELLTNTLPFAAESTMQILRQVIQHDPVLPSKVNSRVPRELDAICYTAMVKDKSKRYENAQELADDLGRFLNDEEIYARLPNPLWQVWDYISSPKGITTISIVLSLTLVLYLFFRPSAKKDNTSLATLKSLEKNQTKTAKHHYLYANSLIKLGFYKRARQHLELALVMNSKEIPKDDIKEKLVLTLTAHKEYKKALKYFLSLSTKRQLKPDMSLAAAKIYYHLNRLSKADDLLKELIKNTDDLLQIKAESVYYSALIAYYRAKYPQALDLFLQTETILQTSRAHTSHYPLIKLYIGICYFYGNNINKSLLYLIQARSLLPEHPLVFAYMGRCYLAMEKSKNNAMKARDVLRKCIELEPNNSDFHNWYGNALQQIPDYASAKKAYNRSLELNSGNFDSVSGLLEISYNDLISIEKSFSQILYHTRVDKNLDPPDLLRPTIEQVARNYENNYLQWWKLSKKKQANPQTFLKTLAQNHSQEVYSTAIQALSTLRYQKRITKVVEKFLNSGSLAKTSRQRITRAWSLIKTKKSKEQDFITYYKMAQIYLANDIQIAQQFNNGQITKMRYILQNSQEKTVHRYLAAKTLLLLLDFKTVERLAFSKDKLVASLCNCALKEIGLPVGDRFTSLPQKPFARALIARNMNYKEHIWQSLKRDSQEQTRIYAAAGAIIFAQQNKVKPLLLKEARDLLIENLDHSSPQVRSYAHYYLWASFQPQDSELSKYQNLFIKGVRDHSVEVRRAVMSHQNHFNFPEYMFELEKLVKEQSQGGPLLRLSVANICIRNGTHPILNQLINDQKVPYSVRLIVFMSSTFVIYNERTQEKVLNRMNKFISEFPSLARDPNPHFRFIMLIFAFLVGLQPIHYEQEEKNKDVLAHLLFSFRFKLLKQTFHSSFRELKMLTKYLNHPYGNIRMAAHSSHVALASKKQHEMIYLQVQKKDKASRKGVALGFYNLVRFSILKALPRLEIFQVRDQKAHYQVYLHSLLVSCQNPKLRKDYRTWLTYAIKLDENHEYLYERALVYEAGKNYSLAVKDLRRALKHSPGTSHYIAKLGEIYYKMGQKSQTLALFRKYSLQYGDRLSAEIIGDLLLRLKKKEQAKKLFFQLYLLNQEHYGIYLHIARVYALEQNKKATIRYLQYLQKKMIISQSLIQSYPEFKYLLNDPWIRSLPYK